MIRGIYAAVASLSFFLLSGCNSSTTANQAVTSSPAQPTVSTEKAENATAVQSANTAVPSDVSSVQPKTSNSTVSSNTSGETNNIVSEQGTSSGQNSGKETDITNQDQPKVLDEQPATNAVPPSSNNGQQIAVGTDSIQNSPQQRGQTGSTTVTEADAEKGNQVKAKYAAQLTKLKGYYLDQLQNLYNQAVASKHSGQSNHEIYNTFSQQVGTLEEDSQEKVNQILFQMKDELKSDSLPTDSVHELGSTYYAEMTKAQVSFAAKAKIDFSN